MSNQNIGMILTAIDDLRKSNNETHQGIKDTVTAGISGLHLKIEADTIVTTGAIQELTRELKLHNGRLKKVEEAQEAARIKFVKFDKHVAVMTTIKKRWVLLVLGLILFFSGIDFLIQTGFLPKIINFLITKL